MMNALRRDLRFAWRLWIRRPAFLAAAVVTLALGIGLNSAVFSVVNAVLFRPLPVAAPHRLVSVYTCEPGEPMSHGPTSAADFDDLRRDTPSLAQMVATTYTPLAVEDGATSRLVLGERVSRRYFEFLGVEPVLGRAFAEQPDADDVAVLGHAAWQRRYGADPAVIGRTVRVNGRPLTVVGVAPPGFFGLTRGFAPEMWLPLDLEAPERRDDRDHRWLWVTGRLAAQATVAGARAEIATLEARLRQAFPASHRDRAFAAVATDRVRFLPGVDRTLYAASFAALGGVALVLLIAAANVAHLLLARAAERRREIATRLTLGARPAAIVRQLLTESCLLAGLGALLGLGLAVASNQALGALRLPVTLDVALGLALDLRVVAFTVAAALATALIFGLAPAVDAARTDLAAALHGGTAAGGRRRRWTSALVVAQVALSLLLVGAAVLAVESLARARRIDPGFDARGVVVASLGPRLQGYSPRRAADFYRRLTEEVRALPEVEAAGLVSHLPLSAEMLFERVAAADDGGREPEPDAWLRVDAASAGPGWFETLRVPLLSGRTFDDHDTADAPRAAVVNRSLARRLWPDADAVGRRLRVAGAAGVYEVIGVVGDGKYRTLGEPPRPFLYLAFDQGRWARSGENGEISTGSETLAVRVSGASGPVLAALRRTIRELDDRIAMSRLSTLEEALAPALTLPRTAAAVCGIFGLLALVLAATGIYGVMAYAGSRRTRELGIRRALGARRADVLWLVLRDGLELTSAGVAAGWAGALTAGRALEAFLYGVGATDPATWAAVSLVLGAVALAACWVPARRAAVVDPWTALRHE